MRWIQVSRWVGLFLMVALTAISVSAQNSDRGQHNRRTVRARLTGYQEVPSISTSGRGEFGARLDDATIDFRLNYSELEGEVLQAHIHVGQRSVNGGITVFLCTNLGNGPAGTPPCPQEGAVTGVRMAADIVGPAGQGIEVGEFEEVLKAIRSGNTYVNVHTVKHPGGEIRGQIRTDSDRNPH